LKGTVVALVELVDVVVELDVVVA
jgi:hypothetical protein